MLSLDKSADNNILDINIENFYEDVESVTFEISFHPDSRVIRGEDYSIRPYEDYTKSDRGSLYKKNYDTYAIISGIMSSLAMTGLYSMNHRLSDFTDLEQMAIISWAWWSWYLARPFFERFLKDIVSKKEGLFYNDDSFSYIKHHKQHDLSSYIDHARRNRYNKNRILPQYINLEKSSNGFTLTLKFNWKQFTNLTNHENTSENKINIWSLRFDNKKLMEKLKKEWFMLWVQIKVKEKKKWMIGNIIHTKHVIEQAIMWNKVGIIDDTGSFVDNKVKIIKSDVIGRLEFNVQTNIIDNIKIVSTDTKEKKESGNNAL